MGKSSTINKLMQEKKVTVSATPGKTKHFQSLFLNEGARGCLVAAWTRLTFPHRDLPA